MKTINNERGTILITMLLLMVIVTLLGVIAINTSTIDIQITGYSKRETQALQGAEAGIDLSIPIIENTIAAGQLTTSGTGISTIIPITIPTTLGSTTTNYDIATIGGVATNLEAEILNDQPGGATGELSVFNADISITQLNSAGVQVEVDIDRMYSYIIAGGSLEFASGYEGIGAGAGGGGVGILYKIDSRGTK